MKYPEFGKCKTAALEELKYTDGKLCYGIYTPLSDKNMWDERWLKENCLSFLHWWIETEDSIVDTGSRQFGEESYKIVPLNDKRYKKVGFEIDNKKYTITNEVHIDWNSLVPEETIKITWPKYDKYLTELGV